MHPLRGRDDRLPLTVDEAALQLGCSRRRVLWLYAEGHLHGWNTGQTAKTIRFEQAAVDAFKRAHGLDGAEDEAAG